MKGYHQKKQTLNLYKACEKRLREIINIKLSRNGFESNFITKAIMNFEIPIDNPRFKNTVYCYSFIEDRYGKLYKPRKRIIETVYEVDFNPIRKLETKA